MRDICILSVLLAVATGAVTGLLEVLDGPGLIAVGACAAVEAAAVLGGWARGRG